MPVAATISRWAISLGAFGSELPPSLSDPTTPEPTTPAMTVTSAVIASTARARRCISSARACKCAAEPDRSSCRGRHTTPRRDQNTAPVQGATVRLSIARRCVGFAGRWTDEGSGRVVASAEGETMGSGRRWRGLAGVGRRRRLGAAAVLAAASVLLAAAPSSGSGTAPARAPARPGALREGSLRGLRAHRRERARDGLHRCRPRRPRPRSGRRHARRALGSRGGRDRSRRPRRARPAAGRGLPRGPLAHGRRSGRATCARRPRRRRLHGAGGSPRPRRARRLCEPRSRGGADRRLLQRQ